MSNPIAAREQARQHDGKFGAQQHSEPKPVLTPLPLEGNVDTVAYGDVRVGDIVVGSIGERVIENTSEVVSLDGGLIHFERTYIDPDFSPEVYILKRDPEPFQFPTDVASATDLIEQIPDECFETGPSYCRGAIEARSEFRQCVDREDDTGAAIAAMDAWTAYRIRSGHRDEALDQIAEFRRQI